MTKILLGAPYPLARPTRLPPHQSLRIGLYFEGPYLLGLQGEAFQRLLQRFYRPDAKLRYSRCCSLDPSRHLLAIGVSQRNRIK